MYIALKWVWYQEGIAHLVPPLPPNPSTRVRIRGEAFGGFGGLGRLWVGYSPLPPDLLAYLGCTPAIGAQWVAPLTGKKKLKWVWYSAYKYFLDEGFKLVS